MMTHGKINESGAERSNKVDQILADSGVAFKESLWFAAGTELIQVGKRSVAQSRKKWEDKDSFLVMKDKAAELYAKQGREDRRVDLRSLHMSLSGKLLQLPGAQHRSQMTPTAQWTLSQLCLGQLASRANPDCKYAGPYLASINPELRAHNLNEHLADFRAKTEASAQNAFLKATADLAPESTDAAAMASLIEKVRGENEPEPVVFRTMIDPATNERGVYAIVSTRYQAYDLPQGVDDFLKLLGDKGLLEGAKGEVMVNGPKWSVTVYFHNPIPTDAYTVGDILHCYVRLRGVDDGTGSMAIESGWTRTRCINNTTIFTRAIEGGIRHTGKQIAERLLPTLDKALAAVAKVSDLWDHASKSYIIDQAIADGAGMRYVFEQLVEKGYVRLQGYGKETLVNRCMEGWAKEGGQCTRAAVSNALTWAAHTQTWNSLEDSEEIEAQAGRLLYAKIVIPTPEQVQAERVEASRWGLLEVN